MLMVLHKLGGENRDKEQKNTVDEQIGQMEIFSVGIPFHLQILLAQGMRQQLHSSVTDHGLVG